MNKTNKDSKTSFLEEIKKVNEMTDIKKVQSLKEHIMYMNARNDENKEIFELAREKSII